MAKFDPDAFLGTTEPAEKKKKGFDPDAFLATPQPAARETAAQTFGRSAASAADSILNTITGTLDVPARALARAYYGGVQGMPLAQAEQRAVAETTSPKDVFGRAFGVANTAGYQQAPLRQLGTALGETIGENVIQPVAQATGLPETYVGDVASMLPVPAAPTVARAAGRAATSVVDTGRTIKQATPEFARGVMGQASGKGTKPGELATYAGQYESARQPAGTTYYKPEDLQAWREGMIDTTELNKRATPYTPEQAAALSRTGGMVPYTGQVARAAGESFIEPYTSFKGYIPDIALGAAGTMLGVGPFLGPGLNMLRRGVQATNAVTDINSMRQLGDLGFSPMFPEELAAIRRGEPNPSVITPPVAAPVRPQPQAAAPSPVTTQPVAPTDFPRLEYNPTQPVMYGSETGIVGRTPDEVIQADLAQRYAPQPVAPNPMASQVTPEIQQATAQGLSASDNNKQRILDLIRNANAKKAVDTEPTVTPVAPTELPVAQTVTPEMTPSEQIMSAIPDMAKKSMPEIRFDIKNTGKGAITSKNNVIQLDKAAYDDLAAQHGVTLNWAEMGELKKGAGDAREQVNKFVENKIKEQRGPEKRGPQMRTLQKQAEAELGITGKEELTPEMRKRLGITETTKPAPTISPALQALLDKQKAAGKYKPPGALEMITDQPDAVTKIKQSPWLDRADYEQSVFMQELGLNPGQEFIAKMRAPEGSVIRAVDDKIDSEAIQYTNGDGFMTRKFADGDVQYSVINADGTRFEITKRNDKITEIELRNNEEIIASYEPTIFRVDPEWMVVEKLPDGSNKMVYNYDRKSIKNPKTRELLDQVMQQDYNAVVNEQLAKAEALKKGK